MSDPLPNNPIIPHLGATETSLRAANLKRTEHVFGTWGHVVPEGANWRACLSREYWFKNFEKLSAGDTVQIQTADHRVWFEMLILYVNAATDPVTFEAVFRPIYPADLELPALAKQRPPRFEGRTFPGGDGSWCVVDLRTGERTHENSLRKQAALELSANLQRAADNAEAEAQMAELYQPPTAAMTAAAAPRPAAAEGAYHLHPVADDQLEIHGPGCAVVAVGFESREDAERVLAAFNPSPVAVADVVRVISVKEPRSRSSRPRGRPRKPAPGRSPDNGAPPPMAAAPAEG
jgi:hypothetical protein